MADKNAQTPPKTDAQASSAPAEVVEAPTTASDAPVAPTAAQAQSAGVSASAQSGSNPALAGDGRSRHGTQAVEVTTGGISRELGIRKLSGTGAPITAPVLEMTYLALVQITINCDVSMEGVPQYFTLAPGMYIQSGQTVDGAGGTPVALITAEDPGVNIKTLYTAKALGATENAPVTADTPLDIGDTSRKNLLTITVTGAAGGTARLALNAGIILGGWK